MTELTAAEVDRRLDYFIRDRFEPLATEVNDQADDVESMGKEVSKICGQVEVITRLMWGIILALVGLLIQGAIG